MTLRGHFIKLNLLLKDRVVFWSFVIGLLLNLLLWAFLIYRVRPQLEPLLLHYNIFLGIDLIGPWWKMYFIPGLGSGILVFNFILGWMLFLKEKILSYFLFIAFALLQVFLIVSTIFIILINY